MNPANPQALNPFVIATGLYVIAVLAAMIGAWAWVFVRLLTGRPLLPVIKPKAVPWGLGSVVLVIGLWLAAQVAAGWLYAHSKGWDRPEFRAQVKAKVVTPEISTTDQVLWSTAANLAVLGVVPAFLVVTSRARAGDFGLSGPGRRWQLIRGIMAFLVVGPIVYLLNVVMLTFQKGNAHPVTEVIANAPTGWPAAVAGLAAIVVAPAVEELIFRGVFLGWLLRLSGASRPAPDPLDEPILDVAPDQDAALDQVDVITLGEPSDNPWAAPSQPVLEGAQPSTLLAQPASPVPDHAAPRRGPAAFWIPNLLVSGLFAGLHYGQWPAPVPLFVLALALGYLYYRTGSLLASFALHATFNAFATIAMFLIVLSGAANSLKKPAPAPSVITVPGEHARMQIGERSEKAQIRAELGLGKSGASD